MRKNKSQEKRNKKTSIEGDLDVTKSDILDLINTIFLNNASYSKEQKEYYLNRNNINLIMKQSKMFSKQIISKAKIDVILSDLFGKKSKYNLLDFINFLTELCHYLYEDDYEEDPKETFNYFVNCLFNNYEFQLNKRLSNNFMMKTNDNSCTIICIETIMGSRIEKYALKLLISLYSQFKSLYSFYFQLEISKKGDNNKILNSSMEKLLEFSIDFEIVPYIINKSNLITYFNYLIKYQIENPGINQYVFKDFDQKKYRDLGVIFKFSSFILFIYHFSLFLFYKNYKQTFQNTDIIPNDIDKILIFLEKLDNSGGKNKYYQKKGRIDETKFILIPTKEATNIARKEFTKQNDKKNRSKKMTTQIEISTNNNATNNTELSKDNNNNLTTFKGNIICREGIRNCTLIDKDLLKSMNSLRISTTENYEKNKVKFKEMLSLLDLSKILSVSQNIIDLISQNLEPLSEIFMRYSSIMDKLDYNQLTMSSYIKFLVDADIVIAIPESMKKIYDKMSTQIQRKNLNVSEVKKYNINIKGSVPCYNLYLTSKEKEYKSKLGTLLNASKENFREQISQGEASVVFFLLTNAKNFPDYIKNIKSQFDKNSGIDVNFGEQSKSFNLNNRMNYENKNVPSKMDFVLFIKSFELLAAKLYPEKTLDEAVLNMFNNKIMPLFNFEKIISSDKMKDALNKINNEDVKKFLIKLSPVILPIFNIYSDKCGYMRFFDYFGFYKTFDIFPELISLAHLKSIFYVLCESNYDKENNTQTHIDKIDFNLFLESFAMIAMFFNFKDIISDIDRLLYECYTILYSSAIQGKMDGTAPAEVTKNFVQFFKEFKEDMEKIDNDDEEKCKPDEINDEK